MCNETAKAYDRRVKLGWFDKYLVGSGIDIGCGYDKLQSPYASYLDDVGRLRKFECRGWDTQDGDAQYLRGIADESFDFVYSSHCLEHMVDPSEALRNWWRVLRHGGFLVVVVPDENLYEQGVWPSKGNGDHKTTWTVFPKPKSWSPVSRSLAEEINKLLPNKGSIRYAFDGVPDKDGCYSAEQMQWVPTEIVWLKQVDTNYDYELAKRGWVDQTGQCIGGVEAAVECVVQKP